MEKPKPEFLEAGQGPNVLLLHSSVSGAGQWRSTFKAFGDHYRMIAPNLFGYGATQPWDDNETQSLMAQAQLAVEALPETEAVHAVIGHSFGGSVAMKTAAQLGKRVSRLVLIEPNPFYLLALHGREDAYQEALDLRAVIKQAGSSGDWSSAAERFANYWTGDGGWASMPEERQSKFAFALQPNFHEWDAVIDELTSLSEWRELLPTDTTVIWSKDTVLTIRTICELMEEHIPEWTYQTLDHGGHMAPLTRPDEINRLIGAALV